MHSRYRLVFTKVLALCIALGAAAIARPVRAQTIGQGGSGQPAESFTLSIAPGAQNLSAGGSGSYVVMTKLITGVSEKVSLSVSGLPAGVTASLNPVTVVVGQSSTLTLAASPSATNGTASFTVTAAGTQAVASGTANVTISGGGGGGGCPSGWTDVGGVCVPGGCAYAPGGKPTGWSLARAGLVALVVLRRRRD